MLLVTRLTACLRRRIVPGVAAAVVVGTAIIAAAPAQGQGIETAESRAVAFLKAEVPRWRREHPCYSCHNNGDAARALLVAAGRGHALGDVLDDTLSWLALPGTWDQSATRGGSADLPLGRIQFSSALAAAMDAGRATPPALFRAAELVASHQGQDGSWTLDPAQTLGGATFYGRALATAMARRLMARAPGITIRDHLARADAWLRSFEVASVTDAAAAVIGLGTADDAPGRARGDAAAGLLAKAQGPDGGWGPYVTSPSEVFDTALAVWALAGAPRVEPAEARQAMVRRGRSYLLEQQQPDGSWPETTRPSGGESYAQRISTTAWALLALLESQ